MRPHFRFEDLEIWQLARDLAIKFHRLAAKFEAKRLYRMPSSYAPPACHCRITLLKVLGAFTIANLVNFSILRVGRFLKMLPCCLFLRSSAN